MAEGEHIDKEETIAIRAEIVSDTIITLEETIWYLEQIIGEVNYTKDSAEINTLKSIQDLVFSFRKKAKNLKESVEAGDLVSDFQ